MGCSIWWFVAELEGLENSWAYPDNNSESWRGPLLRVSALRYYNLVDLHFYEVFMWLLSLLLVGRTIR